uniref:Uncharacterized protein n=1 Tax=Thermogemmatispora argillosa TaxID=2045280 RepID=A0A455SXD0_9CHLR|nr:hypothetical protein KTA_12720 [Thermogemmatispora argillosa]
MMTRQEAEALAERIRNDREARVTVLRIQEQPEPRGSYHLLCVHANGLCFLVTKEQDWQRQRQHALQGHPLTRLALEKERWEPLSHFDSAAL